MIAANEASECCDALRDDRLGRLRELYLEERSRIREQALWPLDDLLGDLEQFLCLSLDIVKSKNDQK